MLQRTQSESLWKEKKSDRIFMVISFFTCDPLISRTMNAYSDAINMLTNRLCMSTQCGCTLVHPTRVKLFYCWKIKDGKCNVTRVTHDEKLRKGGPRSARFFGTIVLGSQGAAYRYRYRFFRKRIVSLSALLCTSYKHNGNYDEPAYKERFPWRLISLVITLGNPLNRLIICVMSFMKCIKYGAPDRIT